MAKITDPQSTLASEEEWTAEPGVLPQVEQSAGEAAVELYCPKCTGPMIKCQVGYVSIYGWWLERVSRQAGALGPPRTISSEVAAQTCIRCGYTELYAIAPSALLYDDDMN